MKPWADLTEEIRPIAESMAEHPTEFELITAIAFLHFLRSHCDLVVLEVGLGGALDASNVIDVPEVAVITALGMDHMAQLGPTLRDIAAAKAGIIKPGGCVVSYGGCPEADEVIRSVCREQHADLTEVDFSRLSVQQADLQGNRFDFLPHRNLELPLAWGVSAPQCGCGDHGTGVSGPKGVVRVGGGPAPGTGRSPMARPV